MDQESLKVSLLKEFGLDTLSLAQQEEALLKIGNLIFQGVLLRAMDSMKSEDKTALEKLLSKNQPSPEKMFSFLSSKVPNLDSMVKEEVAKFKLQGLQFLRGVTGK